MQVDELKTDFIGTVSVGTTGAFSYITSDGRLIPSVRGAADDGGAGDAQGDTGDGAGGANAGSGGQANSDGGNNTDSDKVVFDAGQQAKIQTLIDDAYKKALLKGTESGNAKTEKLLADIKTLEEKLDSKGKDKSNSDEVTKAIEELNNKHAEEMEKITGKLSNMNEGNKRSAILSAVAKHNVIDASQITNLLWNNIGVSENGEITVKGEGGVPKIDINNGGAPMTIDTFVESWLKENPHHLRSSGSAGGGSGSSKFGGDGGSGIDFSNPQAVRDAPIGELKAALSAGVEIEGSRGQKFGFKGSENKFLARRKERIAEGK